MKISLGYNKKSIEFNLNEKYLLDILKPNSISINSMGENEVIRALQNPISSPRLKDIINKDDKIAIITSDITRPMPSNLVLPVLLEELKQANIENENIKIIFALGSHRKHTEKEKKQLVGKEIYRKIECIDSDMYDYINLGTTSAGTPVNIFRPVVEADKRICLGNIEYHYFAGYSGGAKAIMPGVSTRESIQSNHSMMVMNQAKVGAIIDNPLRMDIEEVENFISVDFILNVILNEKKEIIKAVAGHHKVSHRKGCEFLDKIYKVKIPKLADVVIVSPGGYPKDINLYQAQKSLDNAKNAVRKGGIIIWVASCKEGYGEVTFERWMKCFKSPEEMILQIQKNFKLGGHKAVAIAKIIQNNRVFIVSDLDKSTLEGTFLDSYESVDKALDSALESLGHDISVLVMPNGGSTLPVVKE